MRKSVKITLLSLSVLLCLTNNICGLQPLSAKIPLEGKIKNAVNPANKSAIKWIALPAPAATSDNGKPDIPLDSKGRIKAHIIRSEREVRYLVNNLEKSPIYPKIIKSCYFFRSVSNQWDKKKAIGLINARMKTLVPGESILWFQLAGIDAYARRYTRGVPNAEMSYAYIFSYSHKLSKLYPELFYRLISEMTHHASRFPRSRNQLPVNNKEKIILELLTVYLTVEKLSYGEPLLSSINQKKLKALLETLDKSEAGNFNYLYRSVLLPLYLNVLEPRIALVTDHPDFASQPANIKRQFYLHLARRYTLSSTRDEHLKWLTKAVEAGAGYSKLLKFHNSYQVKAVVLKKRLAKLEKKFSTTKKIKQSSSVKNKSSLLLKKMKEIEKFYKANSSVQYMDLYHQIRRKYPQSTAAAEYLELLSLRNSKRQRQKKFLLNKQKFDKLLAKALKDYTPHQDSVDMFKFIRDSLKQEDAAYNYLDGCSKNITDPSGIKLRMVYILVKKTAKSDKAKALSILKRVDFSKYDTSYGGATAFRLRMLAGLKSRLQKK